ncbi:MAG: hypothetical protein DSY76_02135, partial [Bacteroidetes bacterium]
GDLHQARATLNSIVEGVTDYPELLQKAKDLLKEIDAIEAKEKKEETSDDMMIEFNQDEKLFIGDYDDGGLDDEEYLDSEEEEEEEGGAK